MSVARWECRKKINRSLFWRVSDTSMLRTPFDFVCLDVHFYQCSGSEIKVCKTKKRHDGGWGRQDGGTREKTAPQHAGSPVQHALQRSHTPTTLPTRLHTTPTDMCTPTDRKRKPRRQFVWNRVKSCATLSVIDLFFARSFWDCSVAVLMRHYMPFQYVWCIVRFQFKSRSCIDWLSRFHAEMLVVYNFSSVHSGCFVCMLCKHLTPDPKNQIRIVVQTGPNSQNSQNGQNNPTVKTDVETKPAGRAFRWVIMHYRMGYTSSCLYTYDGVHSRQTNSETQGLSVFEGHGETGSRWREKRAIYSALYYDVHPDC